VQTQDNTQRSYYGLAINADGSRLVAVTNATAIYIANWSVSSNNYTQFTQTLDTITGRLIIGIGMTQSGDRIAYSDYSGNNVYIAYWNGSNYGSGKLTNNNISVTLGRNLAFSKDASILYYSIETSGTNGSLYAAYYNSLTQNYGSFNVIKPNANTSLSTARAGYGMCMSPDGSRLYLTNGTATSPWSGMLICNTLLYTANGEWIQVQLARPAKLTSYGFISRSNLENRLPRQFLLLGSNDGATWFLVDSQDIPPLTNRTSQGGTSNTYTSFPAPAGNNCLTMFAPSTTYATNFYSYYRLVSISVFGDYCVCIGQIVLNGIYL
jgi:hypothetical protein